MINHTNSEDATGKRRRARGLKGLGVALTASALLVMSALPAWAAENMTITFIRHGQSYGNTSGNIDTQTPGPILTPNGYAQAAAIVNVLGDRNFDAIYASSMVRTQLTAAPMSQYLGLPIQVLPGLREIEAGMYEGTPEAASFGGYLQAPLAWAGLRQVTGDPLDQRIPDRGVPGDANYHPGTDGHEFEARVNAALQTMYDNGDRNVAAFSHGGTIMFWTMMNASNLTTAQKGQLLSTAALSNTNYVVVEGNNEDGWRLLEWYGFNRSTGQNVKYTFDPQPTFWNNLKLQRSTLDRQLTEAWQPVKDAFQTHDWSSLASAFNHAIADAKFASAKYHRAVNVLIQDKLKEIFTPAPAATVAPTNVVADTPASNAAPQSIAPASDPAPEVAKVSSLAADNTGDAKVDDTPATVKTDAAPQSSATGDDNGSSADNDKPARTERPSHKVRDTAKSDDQGSTTTPKHSDTVKKSKKSKTSTSSDAGSSDNGSQSDAA